MFEIPSENGEASNIKHLLPSALPLVAGFIFRTSKSVTSFALSDVFHIYSYNFSFLRFSDTLWRCFIATFFADRFLDVQHSTKIEKLKMCKWNLIKNMRKSFMSDSTTSLERQFWKKSHEKFNIMAGEERLFEFKLHILFVRESDDFETFELLSKYLLSSNFLLSRQLSWESIHPLNSLDVKEFV